MAVTNLEIKGSVKKTKGGDIDALKGGEGVTGQDGIAWATLADAYAGIPNIGVVGSIDNPPLRLGKVFSVKDGDEVKDYWWNDVTKLANGQEVPYGAGTSSFADLTGSPYDNTALGAELIGIEEKADNAQTDVDNLEVIVAAQATALATKLNKDMSNIYGITAGTATAYTLTLTPAITSLVVGQLILYKYHVASGTNPTMNVNSTGAKTLVRTNGTAISTSNTNRVYMAVYDGTNWQQVAALDTDSIINGTAAQIASFYITLTGRIDGGLGLGLAANAASFLSIAAATSAKAQVLLTQGTVDYTGTVNGMLWNIAGEIKFLESSIVNRLNKIYNNELFKSDGNYSLGVNQYGDMYAVNKEVEAYVYDSDLIAAITSATYIDNEATIAVSGKTVYVGQKYYDETTHYMYEAWDDNKIFRR